MKNTGRVVAAVGVMALCEQPFTVNDALVLAMTNRIFCNRPPLKQLYV